MTTPSPPDPLLDALRAALPPAQPTAADVARVHRLARALVQDAPTPLPRPSLARALLLGGAVVGYFTWAVLFVLATHLAP